MKIKSVGVALLLLGFLLVTPHITNAESNLPLGIFEYIDDLNEEINDLTTSISGSGQVAGESISLPDLNRSLYIGLRDNNPNGDVSQLQRFLKEQGDYDYPEITGYFGPITEASVKKWQSRNGVVSSGTPATTGYGVVGPKTRAKILSFEGLESDQGEFPEEGSARFTLVSTSISRLSDSIYKAEASIEIEVEAVEEDVYFRKYEEGGWLVSSETKLTSVEVEARTSSDETAKAWLIEEGDTERFKLTAILDNTNGEEGLYRMVTESFNYYTEEIDSDGVVVSAGLEDFKTPTIFLEGTDDAPGNEAPEFTYSKMIQFDDPIEVGDKVVFVWGAVDPDGDGISWTVDWGDRTVDEGICPVRRGTGQRHFAVHSWEKEGEYSVEPFASDCMGNTTVGYGHTFRVKVGEVATSGPKIVVLSPNGGEVWKHDGTYKIIRWDTEGIPRNARMKIGMRNTETNRDYVLEESTPNDGRENLLLHIKAPAGPYFLFIKTSVDGRTIDDWSDGKFQIVGNDEGNYPPTATISGPVQVIAGEVEFWAVYANDKEGDDLEFFANWGDGVIEKGEGVRETSTKWRAKFSHQYNDPGTYEPEFTINDGSGNSTKVSQKVTVQSEGKPYLYVIDPNGGESFERGDLMTIRWGSENYPSSAPVEITLREILSGSNLGRKFSVTGSTPNDGYYRWYIPYSIPSSTYKIYVTCGSSIYSLVGCTGKASERTFEIGGAVLGEINIVYPDGGEVLTRGSRENLVWTNGTRTDVDLILVSDTKYPDQDGAGSYIIARNVDWTSEPKQTYGWTVGDFVESTTGLRTMPDGSYHFEVCPIGTEKDTNCGIGSASFRISSDTPQRPTIEIKEPATGESIIIGSPARVYWDYSGDISRVNIYMRSGSGSNCTGLICTNVFYPEIRYEVATDVANRGYFDMIAGLTKDNKLLSAGPYTLEVCDSSSTSACGSVNVSLVRLSSEDTEPLPGTRGSLDTIDLATYNSLMSLVNQLASVTEALR